MGFLRSHFEKVALGLCLVGFLLSCFYLFHGLQKAVEEVRLVEDKANQSVTSGKQLDRLLETIFDAPAVITDPKVEFKIAGVDGRNSLMFPDKFIRCANSECPNLVPFETAICPFCGQKEPPDKPTVDPTQDFDEDGLPNGFEVERPYLDQYDPNDAQDDQDKDGFTNLEEYQAKTVLDDPKSHPPLVDLLRFEGGYRNFIPLLLVKITRNNSDDPAMWDIQCDVIEKGQKRRKSFRLGAKVGGYEITEVNYKVDPQYDKVRRRKIEIDQSQLTLKSETTEDTYVLDVGKPAYEKDMIVKLFFLNNRYNPRRCQRFEVKLGEKFPLSHPASGDVENYTLISATPTGVEIKRTDENVEEQEFAVRKLDPQKDFMRRATGAGPAEGQGVPPEMR
ncbi:MAG: hypothetical protein A3K19_12800 [Lentisphaerae bacterium RIFOXYB12_FULL_65_16]|nr:MAG: hypothetical protein A3K18_13605 [Lentisphaerae bacterium RIFOXYA12_64_32]OGV87192.1 MAG: hypothetical protein A3K19_12800 [Lentisphaerae bacterium RIFOXYB12_FULL_65_16]